MTRTRARFGRLALVLGVVLGGATLAGRAAAGTEQAPPAERHVVVAGDTLWRIAASRAGASGDPRPVVHAIREANGLRTSQLFPGQILVLPGPD